VDTATTKLMNTRTLFSAFFLASLLGLTTFLSSCSDLKTDLPQASTSALSVHPDGWVTTASADFHGNTIRSNKWDMRQCRACHGTQYTGGTSDVSCYKCHNGYGGPQNCAVCHGTPGTNAAPPRDLSKNTAKTARGVGAHQIHYLGSSLAGNTICTECHRWPADVYNDTNHIDGDGVAEVVFLNPLANLATPGVTPSPTYNSSTMTCASTYCHGVFKNGNPSFAPVWNDASGAQMACGTCHGDVTKPTTAEKALPKIAAQGGTHPNNLACASCHDGVVDATLKIINPAKHVDGRINLLGNDISFF